MRNRTDGHSKMVQRLVDKLPRIIFHHDQVQHDLESEPRARTAVEMMLSVDHSGVRTLPLGSVVVVSNKVVKDDSSLASEKEGLEKS